MLTLRDFLAAKSVIAKDLMDKPSTLSSLNDFEQRPGMVNWLKALVESSQLAVDKARLVQIEVDKFEYLRSETLYVKAALDLGVAPEAVEAAAAASREVGYQRRVSVFLLSEPAISEALHLRIIARARNEFLQDAARRLDSFRQTLSKQGPAPAAGLSSQAERLNDPNQAHDLTSTFAIPSKFSGELVPESLGATLRISPEQVRLSSEKQPRLQPASPGNFSFSADQLRSADFTPPQTTPPGNTPGNLAPNLVDVNATMKQSPSDRVSPAGADSPAKPCPSNRLIDDPILAAAIASRYDIEKILGQGQMGTVFLAHSKELNQKVALKLAQPKGRNAAEVIDRFKREILVTALVSHPNIVEVYDQSELPDGSFYMAMELLEGQGLKDFLREKGSLALEQALDIVEQLTRALKVCHDAKVVHRDVKPENLTITEKNGVIRIKLVDFGLARFLTQEEIIQSRVFTSIATQVSGSPHYMAPESITDADKIDYRCDLYALGVTFFELITGKRPFDGKSHKEILAQQLNSSAPLLEDVIPEKSYPKSLEATIRKLMEKDRDLRYQCCDDVLKALMAIRADMLESSKPRKRKSILRKFADLFKSKSEKQE
jgi:hypothetical protein